MRILGEEKRQVFRKYLNLHTLIKFLGFLPAEPALIRDSAAPHHLPYITTTANRYPPRPTPSLPLPFWCIRLAQVFLTAAFYRNGFYKACCPLGQVGKLVRYSACTLLDVTISWGGHMKTACICYSSADMRLYRYPVFESYVLVPIASLIDDPHSERDSYIAHLSNLLTDRISVSSQNRGHSLLSQMIP